MMLLLGSNVLSSHVRLALVFAFVFAPFFRCREGGGAEFNGQLIYICLDCAADGWMEEVRVCNFRFRMDWLVIYVW